VADREPRTKLARVRRKAGVAQQDLAYWTGLSRSTVQRLELGETSNPPIRYLTNCALVLGCALEDLIENEWRHWSVFDDHARRPPTEAQREAARRRSGDRLRR